MACPCDARLGAASVEERSKRAGGSAHRLSPSSDVRPAGGGAAAGCCGGGVGAGVDGSEVSVGVGGPCGRLMVGPREKLARGRSSWAGGEAPG